MSEDIKSSPLGHVIDAFRVRGKENIEGRWVGADMELDIRPAGRFLLTIVIKEHYANEHLEQSLEDIEHIERLLDDTPVAEQRLPFVLNDREITDDILERKFRNRRVEQDLADSLWYDGPSEQ